MTRASLTWVVLLAVLVAGCAAGLLVGDGDLSDLTLRDTYLRLRAWRLGNAGLAGAALMRRLSFSAMCRPNMPISAAPAWQTRGWIFRSSPMLAARDRWCAI